MSTHNVTMAATEQEWQIVDDATFNDAWGNMAPLWA